MDQASARHQAFPATQLTHIGRLLDQGEPGRQLAAGHVMTVYAHPLRVYLLGSTFRRLGDPEDIVRGFFADRLSRGSFLSDWLGSGRPLRYWLLTAFRHYLLEQARTGRNLRDREHHLDDHDQAPNLTPPPADAAHSFHRDAAMQLVHEAMRLAAESCANDGKDHYWRAFLRHHVDNRAYEQLAPEFGVRPQDFKVMIRLAGNRLREALRGLVGWPGATDDHVDAEIHSLMEAIRS